MLLALLQTGLKVLLAVSQIFVNAPVAQAEMLQEDWSEKTSFIPVTFEETTYLEKEEVLGLGDDTLYWVVGIIDGDTILVSDSNREVFQVRLLAVDTKEINGPDSSAQCYGYEASLFTMEFLKNRAVRLSADPANEDLDPYGRKLRYVDVLQEDGSFVSLNKALLIEGYATFPSQYPTTTPDLFSALEQEAKDADMGLWGACY